MLVPLRFVPITFVPPYTFRLLYVRPPCVRPLTTFLSHATYVRTYLGLVVAAVNVDDVSLDGEHGDALGGVDVVPYAQVCLALRHHHVAAGHPLRKRETRLSFGRSGVSQTE